VKGKITTRRVIISSLENDFDVVQQEFQEDRRGTLTKNPVKKNVIKMAAVSFLRRSLCQGDDVMFSLLFPYFQFAEST